MEQKKTIFKYKVSLPNIKGFARFYEIDSNATLYDFHKQMNGDMDFPQDQIVLFKAVTAGGAAIARYATVDMGKGAIDQVTLASCHKNGEDSFVFFYDTTNKKSVLIDFVEEYKSDTLLRFPVLVETKGPNPIEFENGYVAFEDLPDDKRKKLAAGDDDDDDWDDDDEEDEDEDGDDEDGKEVFDEDED